MNTPISIKNASLTRVSQLENVTICGSPIIVESTQGRKLSVELTFDAKIRVKLPARFPRQQALQMLAQLETQWADKIKQCQARWHRYWSQLSEVRLLDESIELVKDPARTQHESLTYDGERLIYAANADGSDYIDALAAFYRAQAKLRIPKIFDDLWSELQWHDVCEPSLKIKRLKSRWGSCSSMCNINLNLWLLAFTQSDLEFVILHEFCHLREMNHSRKFYLWMDRVLPNWRQQESAFDRRVANGWLPFR